jgi:hypothetical protein
LNVALQVRGSILTTLKAMFLAYCPAAYLPYAHRLFNQLGIQMKITLRKANALQNAIQDHIKTISVSATVTLNEFQDAATEMSNANQTLIANDKRRADLTLALYIIRALVGHANAGDNGVGVNGKLARAAYVDKRIAQLKALTESTVAENISVLTAKLEKLAKDEKHYGYRDSITSGVLTQDQINELKAGILALKKEKQTINDEVLELNIRTEITLTKEVVDTLKAEGLL